MAPASSISCSIAEMANGYIDAIERGELKRDSAQEIVAARLEALGNALRGYSPNGCNGLLGRLFTKPSAPPRGLYIWGSVGCGKTMLMDLFFEGAPLTAKRRVHFHAFMQDVHAR